jgi:multiple sugar transport system permease protein
MSTVMRGLLDANALAKQARGYPKRWAELDGLGLFGPSLILLLVLFVLPTICVFAIAMTNWQFGSKSLSFVGLDNFLALCSDRTFRASLCNTVLYVMIVVPTSVGLGLLIALVIESGKRCRTVYRTLHFLPFMATLSAMAIAWEALLHPTIGLVNQTMISIGLPTANWLRDPATALPTLAIIGIWQNLGFSMVMILAGLKSIPEALYDAAAVDGADAWFSRLGLVTLPMLGPVFMFVSIVMALRAFETFDTVQILTQGGPGTSSQVLLYTLYTESFLYMRTGYGAAVTVVFFLIVAGLTLLQTRALDRRVHYS